MQQYRVAHQHIRVPLVVLAALLGLLALPVRAQPSPITLTKQVSQQSAAPGETVFYTIEVRNTSDADQVLTMRDQLHDQLRYQGGFTPPDVACSFAGQDFTCDMTVPAQETRNLYIQVQVRDSAPPGTRIPNVVTADTGAQSNMATLTVLGSSPTPTLVPTLSPGTTPTPDPPTAPCYRAALAAITKNGAIYSQGGALPNDPIDPATGRPYPRTGPDSFDCSGLVWWAYAQAGVPIGATTAMQVTNGTPISCTLDDLAGAATRCWTVGDLVFLKYPGGMHVAIYVGQGLFMDCYNHAAGCVLHDIAQNGFYRRHFYQARRIVSGCEGMTIEPGVPSPPPLPGDPQDDTLCVPDGPNWSDGGVGYSRGCGPPVLPPMPDAPEGTHLRQFTDVVAWLGESGDLHPPGPAGVHLHLGLDIGSTSDMCHWPNQLPGFAEGEPPPGGTTCMTEWADPHQFLPQANGDTLALQDNTPVPVPAGQIGDPTLSEAVVQLPPPGHPAGLFFPPPRDEAEPGGTWWSPGNDDRADGARCPLGGPATTTWLGAILAFLFPWWFGC